MNIWSADIELRIHNLSIVRYLWTPYAKVTTLHYRSIQKLFFTYLLILHIYWFSIYVTFHIINIFTCILLLVKNILNNSYILLEKIIFCLVTDKLIAIHLVENAYIFSEICCYIILFITCQNEYIYIYTSRHENIGSFKASDANIQFEI